MYKPAAAKLQTPVLPTTLPEILNECRISGIAPPYLTPRSFILFYSILFYLLLLLLIFFFFFFFFAILLQKIFLKLE